MSSQNLFIDVLASSLVVLGDRAIVMRLVHFQEELELAYEDTPRRQSSAT